MNKTPVISLLIFLSLVGFTLYAIYSEFSASNIKDSEGVKDFLFENKMLLIFLAFILSVGVPGVAWMLLPDPFIKNGEIVITLYSMIPPVKRFRIPLNRIEELCQVKEKDLNAFMDSKNPNIGVDRAYDGKPLTTNLYEYYIAKKPQEAIGKV